MGGFQSFFFPKILNNEFPVATKICSEMDSSIKSSSVTPHTENQDFILKSQMCEHM